MSSFLSITFFEAVMLTGMALGVCLVAAGMVALIHLTMNAPELRHGSRARYVKRN